MRKVNKIVAGTLLVYPALLVFGAIWYGLTYSINGTEILLTIIAFYVSTITVGIGLHRLWSHNTYKTHPWFERILMWFAAGTLQGPILAWASDHAYHHTFTDKEQDPHSPLAYKSKMKGFLWAHIGWMLFAPKIKKIDRGTLVRLGKKKYLVWQMKHYWSLAIFMNVVPPIILGWLFIGGWQGVFGGFLSIGIGRSVQQQVTFCVNSLCHFVGRRRYVNGTARDIGWFFFALLGENWHNFHHAFPNDYRNGHKWYHADVHKWIIAFMEKIGLAWDLKRTPAARIQAKVQQTKEVLYSFYSWEEIMQNAERIAEQARTRLAELDASSKELAAQMKEHLYHLQAYAEDLAHEARRLALDSKIRKNMLLKATRKLRDIEIKAQYLELPICLPKPQVVH